MSARVLVIGMDSAEPSLLDRWTRDGTMPNLAGLRAAGASAPLEELRGFGNDATWTSFYSGVGPGRHGRYFFRQPELGTYRLYQLMCQDAKRTPFWRNLIDRGLKTAVVDVPYSPIVEGEDCVQLSDWMSHGYTHDAPVSWPAGLIAEVTRRHGTKEFKSCDRHRHTEAEYRGFLETLLRRVQAKGDYCEELLASRNWDLFVTVFADSHCVGHQCWHLHDPGHDRHDPAMCDGLGGDPVRQVYAAIDRQIGRLLAEVDDRTLVLFLTGPGMGPLSSGNFLLDGILRRLEFGPEASGRPVMDPLKALWRRFVPKQLRAKLRIQADRVEDLSLQADRAKRRAYTLPHNDIAGVVRFNLKGREPNGLVEPGADYDRLCAELTEDLLDLEDLDKGGKVVAEVVRTDGAQPGEHLVVLPDLFVIWRKPVAFFRVGSKKIGALQARYVGNRSGDHSHDSLLVARGPGIRPGAAAPMVRTVDVTASILAALGGELGDIDGRPLDWLAGAEAPAPARRPEAAGLDPEPAAPN